VKDLSLLLALLLLTCALGAAQDTPKAEIFLGYTYVRANSGTNVPAFSANGGGGQFVVNVGRYLGMVSDVGSVHNGNIGGYHTDTTLTNFMFGPRIPIRKSHRVIPYFQALFGGVYGSTSVNFTVPPGTVVLPPAVTPVATTTGTNTSAVSLRASSQQTAFAMAFGGGLDIKINRIVSFRPIGLDYYMTRLQNLRTAGDNNQHNIRYTAGFNFTIGGEKPAPPAPPPPPPLKSCWNGTSVPPDQPCPNREMSLQLTAGSSLCAGESITLKPTVDLPGNAALQWSVNGQPTSQGSSFDFGTTGRDPGTYTIGVTASAPEYSNASTDVRVNVLAYRPPSGTLQVSPAEIWAGEKATVSANFAPGQCGGEMRAPQFSASEGSLNGTEFDSSAVQFDPSDNSEQRKTVTLQAKVADQKGVATAEAAVVVKKKGLVAAKRLPDIVFPVNSARVNNCGKRVLLEELKSLIDRDPTGKVVFVGHTAEKEKNELDQRRALNAAAVISAGQGICASFPASQIQVSGAGAADNGVAPQPHFCGTSATPKTGELSGQTVRESDANAKYRRVEVWFIPTGGVVPASVKDSQTATALPVSTLGCPK
jgi:outer membrane protein OmpA-like peptidoglycan-associated protein